MRTFKVTEADDRYPCPCPKDVRGRVCVTVILLVVGWATGTEALESKQWKWITTLEMRWQR